jgi:hypothetical protein
LVISRIYLEASKSILFANGHRFSVDILALPGRFIDAYIIWANTPDDAGFDFKMKKEDKAQGSSSLADGKRIQVRTIPTPRMTQRKKVDSRINVSTEVSSIASLIYRSIQVLTG